MTVRLEAERIPLMNRVLDYAGDGLVPGGQPLPTSVSAPAAAMPPTMCRICCFPPCSTPRLRAGFCWAVPEERLEQAFGLLAEQDEGAWLVGEVLPERLDGKALEIR